MPIFNQHPQSIRVAGTGNNALGAFGYVFTFPVSTEFFQNRNQYARFFYAFGTYTTTLTAGARLPAIFFSKGGITYWSYEWPNLTTTNTDVGLPAAGTTVGTGVTGRVRAWPPEGLLVQQGDTLFVTDLGVIDPLDLFGIAFTFELF